MEKAGAMRADFAAHEDLFKPLMFGHRVTLIGLGGSGSAIAWLLRKMGVMNLAGYDDDYVELSNVTSQLLWSQQLVGMPKAVAMEHFFAANTIDERQKFTGHCQRVDADNLVELDGFVISCVDSMEAREGIFRQIVPHEDDREAFPARYELACENVGRVPYYIDTRMGALAGQFYVVIPEDTRSVAAYETHFFDERDMPAVPYGARAFIPGAAGLASTVAALVAYLASDVKVRNFAELDLEAIIRASHS